jgi:tetratricopeptide (TPR) repeat protein
MRWSVALLFSLAVSGMAQQSAPGSSQADPSPQSKAQAQSHEANFDSERQQANQLWLAGKHLDVLPLYEDLCRQDQTIPVFAERHGLALLEKSENSADPKTSADLEGQGLGELNRAQRLGDNSPMLVQTLYAHSKTPIGAAVGAPMGALPLTVGYTHHGSAQAQALFRQAEVVFGRQDFAGAAPLYVKAAEADAQWYTAALCAGDTYYRMHDSQNAGVWFAKAAAIDPDRETAYRYWADSLNASGDKMGAKAKYIDAVVAEPYVNTTWIRLAAWAKEMQRQFLPPRVQRPNYITENGKLKVDPTLETEMGDGHASWLVYERTRVAHGGLTPGQWIMAGASKANGEFTPNGYVHTLDEEMGALNAMLADVQHKITTGTVTEDRLEPGIKSLLMLQKRGLLEPFVMLNFHDAGLRHGYPAYRAAHRDFLVRYLNSVVTPDEVR